MKTKHVVIGAIVVLAVLVIAYSFASKGWEGIKNQNEVNKEEGRAH